MLIPGPSKLRISEGTGAHHLSGDAIRAAETAQMLPHTELNGELRLLHLHIIFAGYYYNKKSRLD